MRSEHHTAAFVPAMNTGCGAESSLVDIRGQNSVALSKQTVGQFEADATGAARNQHVFSSHNSP